MPSVFFAPVKKYGRRLKIKKKKAARPDKLLQNITEADKTSFIKPAACALSRSEHNQ